jgi:hypothetical protein
MSNPVNIVDEAVAVGVALRLPGTSSIGISESRGQRFRDRVNQGA